MSKLTKILALLALLLPLAIASCNMDRSSGKNGSGSIDSSLIPDTEVSGATIELYKGREMTTKILADRIVKFEAKDSTMGYGLNIDILDSVGHVTSVVVGDSGVIQEETGILNIYGNVVVTTDDGRKLETDSLHWNSKTDQVETDAYVRITKGDDVLTGWGLEADQGLKRVKILKASGSVIDSTMLK